MVSEPVESTAWAHKWNCAEQPEVKRYDVLAPTTTAQCTSVEAISDSSAPVTHAVQSPPQTSPLTVMTYQGWDRVKVPMNLRALCSWICLWRSLLWSCVACRAGGAASRAKLAEEKMALLVKVEQERANSADYKASCHWVVKYLEGNKNNHFAGLDEFRQRVEELLEKQEEKLRKLSIEYDGELYPHMLFAITERKWLISHGLCLAAMSALESQEVKQSFGDVVKCALAVIGNFWGSFKEAGDAASPKLDVQSKSSSLASRLSSGATYHFLYIPTCGALTPSMSRSLFAPFPRASVNLVGVLPTLVPAFLYHVVVGAGLVMASWQSLNFLLSCPSDRGCHGGASSTQTLRLLLLPDVCTEVLTAMNRMNLDAKRAHSLPELDISISRDGFVLQDFGPTPALIGMSLAKLVDANLIWHFRFFVVNPRNLPNGESIKI
ncbi:hypothetical protein Tco_0676514 [Tanacetum coccineum]